MSQINFDQLVQRHGEISAWHFLAEIEKAAGIKPQYGVSDPQARLAHALLLQDKQKASAASDSEHLMIAA